MKTDDCKHPPGRVYTWIIREIINDPGSREIICFGCCDCGESWVRFKDIRRMIRIKRDRASQVNLDAIRA